MTFITHQEIIQKYIIKVGLKSVEEINNQNSFEMIKIAYQDFQNEELSFDDFSTLGEGLFNHPNINRSSEFGLILLEIGELGQQIRKYNNEDSKSYESKLNGVKETLIKLEQYFNN